MLFPTFSFAFFFLAVFLGFWYVFRKKTERTLFLIAASFLFYALWDWRFCFLLALSAAANYGFGYLVGATKEHLYRKLWMIASVVVNLLVLAFFKYYNFFAESANNLLRLTAGEHSPSFLFPALSIIMPVGISFYTFKVMSYVFDVYLCRMTAVRSFPDLLLYVSFFPQIASGPIVHAADFIPSLDQTLSAGIDPDSRPIEFARASVLIMSGLLKKLVFANFLSTLFVDPVLADPASVHALESFLAAIGYSVVIYTDFSGYSDLAIGIALLLGFQTPANFNRPYGSFSVTEFWKRWHITFSSWLRDYLYFSMGGSRFGKVRTLVALVCTMLLGGLWHGASWTFVLWGLMQGTALALERAFEYGNKRDPRWWVSAGQITLTFVFTTISWIVFRAASPESVSSWFASLGGFDKPFVHTSPLVLVLLVGGLAMHAIPDRFRNEAFSVWKGLPLPVPAILTAFFLVALSIVSMSGVAPFIYFSF